MNRFSVLQPTDARLARGRVSAPGPGPAYAVLHVQAHGQPSQRDACVEIISRAVRSRDADTVGDLSDGSFVCLLVGAPGRERLSMLSWKLIDALWQLPPRATPVAPARRRTLQLPGAGPCIGISVGPADGPTFQCLLAGAQAATRRARWLQSGHAFFDERLDA